MKTIKERAVAIAARWKSESYSSMVGTEALQLVREIANAPDPEPVAHAILLPNGATRIWFSDRDSGELWRARERVEQELTPLYTAPPAKNQSEQHLEMVNPPAPSAPDGWRQFLTDVVTAAGLLEHGKRDKGLAGRIGKFAFDAMRAAPPSPSVPDVAQTIPSHDQITQILNGLDRCGVAESKRAFLRTWIRDWTAHKLSAAPPAPSVPSVPDGWKHDCAGIMQNDVELWLDSCPHCGKPKTDSAPTPAEPPAELPTWENGDDPLVGGGLISRGVVDFASLGIWYGKPAPEAEPVAYFTGYNNGYPTIAPINSALCMAIGTALYSAPPAPSAPECLSTGGMTVWGDSVSIEKCNNFVHLASQAAGFKDELINTRAELADVARDIRLQVESEFAALLPGVTYMDEPDGGSPTVQEQIARMAMDAERYWWLTQDHPASEIRKLVDEIGYCLSVRGYGATSAAIDAAIEREILGGSHD